MDIDIKFAPPGIPQFFLKQEAGDYFLTVVEAADLCYNSSESDIKHSVKASLAKVRRAGPLAPKSMGIRC